MFVYDEEWLNQPQEIVRLRSELKPFSALIPSVSGVDLVNGTSWTPFPLVTADYGERAIDLPVAAARTWHNNSDLVIPSGSTATIVAVLSNIEYASTAGVIHTGASAGTGVDEFDIYTPFGGDNKTYFRWGGITEGSTSLSFADSIGNGAYLRHVYLFSVGPAGMSVWRDGVKLASNSATPSRTASGAVLTIGARQIRVHLFATFASQFPEDLNRNVSLNPWLLVAPEQLIIPLAAASTGGLFQYDEEWGGIPQGAAEISDIGRLFTGIFVASGGSGSLLELVSGKYYGDSTPTVGPSGAGIALNGAYFAAPLVLGDTFTRGFVSSGISQPPGSEGTLLFAGNLQFQVNSAQLAVNRAFAFNYMNAVTDMTKPHCFVVVARPDYQCVFMDGALVASYPGGGGYSGSGGGFIGQFGNITTTGQLALAFDSPIALNLGLAAQISANPGLLFESQVSCIPTAQVVAYYPGSDISVAGWTASTGTDLFACVDETTFDDADYITSPDSTTSATMGWSSPVPAGTWSLAIRPMFPEGTSGQIRLVMLDSGNSAVGASAWQTLTGAFVTYTLAITTSGVSDRFRLEIQP